MRLLFSTIGKRGYIADFFREKLSDNDQIIGTGVTPWTPGFHSCDDYVIVPPYTSDEYPEFILDTCRREGIDIILSFADPDVHVLSGIRHRFIEKGVTPFLPDRRAADIAFDKWRTATFLGDLGIDHPRTTLNPSDPHITFPVFVKPRFGSGSADNFLANNRRQLQDIWGRHPQMLIQEFTPGDEIDVEVLGDLDGRPIASSVWSKVRSNLGETEAAETVDEPDIHQIALRAAQELRVCGPMDIDLIRLADGRRILLEFNPRFGGGYPVSHLAGADFPGKILQLAQGHDIAPDHQYERGIAMMKKLTIIGGPKSNLLSRGIR